MEEHLFLHTQYRVLIRHDEAGWLTLITCDDRDMALADLKRLAEAHGAINVKMIADTRYCEPADMLC